MLQLLLQIVRCLVIVSPMWLLLPQIATTAVTERVRFFILNPLSTLHLVVKAWLFDNSTSLGKEHRKRFENFFLENINQRFCEEFLHGMGV